MTAEPEQRWRILCAQAAQEQDPEKLLTFVIEINELLDTTNARSDEYPPRDLKKTVLPIGTKIDNAEIQLCPYCNKHGKLEVVLGVNYYIHSETITADALAPVLRWEMCPRKLESVSGVFY
jgi:hypothetical protein